MGTIQTSKPVIQQIIEESVIRVLDKKFLEFREEFKNDLQDDVREVIREEMRKESDRQYELMRSFMKNMGIEIDDLDRRVRILERASLV